MRVEIAQSLAEQDEAWKPMDTSWITNVKPFEEKDPSVTFLSFFHDDKRFRRFLNYTAGLDLTPIQRCEISIVFITLGHLRVIDSEERFSATIGDLWELSDGELARLTRNTAYRSGRPENDSLRVQLLRAIFPPPASDSS